MANIVYEGFLSLGAIGAGVDYSLKAVEQESIPTVAKITVSGSFGDDHSYEIVGATSAPVNIKFEGLTEAQKSVLIAQWSAKSMVEIIMRPLTGAKSATNPELTIQTYLLNAPTNPGTTTDLYVYETGSINAQYWKRDDGTTVTILGTVSV